MIRQFASLAGRAGLKEKEAERFFKFLVVGTIGFVVDFGTLTFLKEVAHLPTVVANTCSFSAAVLSNFFWNRRWTYPDSRSKQLMAQLSQFALVSIIGLLLNNTILLLLEGPFDTLLADYGYLVAKILANLSTRGYIPAKMIATIVVLFWNFFANRHWTYNDVE